VSGLTVAVDSVPLSAIVDAKEQREAAVVDIPNAFIQTNNATLKSHHETDVVKAKDVSLTCWWRLIMKHVNLI